MTTQHAEKSEYLRTPISHIDIKAHDVRGYVKAMEHMAFQARNLHRASDIYDRMLKDQDCSVILCLAGSLFSAGLKQVVVDMVRHQMVDAIVSTGANIVDQDFFEALGFKHYIGNAYADDSQLRELRIDRIYDTYIDEEELKVCDMTVTKIANELEPRAYSSREFISEMGRYLSGQPKKTDSVILAAYETGTPIFCPAFSDSSAGLGLVHHQWHRPDEHIAIDSAKDFLELTQIKIAAKETGLVMIGGGVPKNFAQDLVIAAEVLDQDVPMHKYAIQLTVADERDGALSSSTLREATSWGKVDTVYEQMVYGEATLTMPLLVGYAFHQRHWEARKARRFADLFAK
ncbi:MAG: deoxyhypusine synthase [Myxococcales bacterium]|nr:deoxyhypusine synthase [Myxococcales bacterium]